MKIALKDRVEDLRFRTDGACGSIEKTLIPYYYNDEIVQTDGYFFEATRFIPEKNEICFRLDGIKFKFTNRRDEEFINKPMKDLIDLDVLYPFMVFIDNKFVLWSKIKITYNLRYFYILITKDKVDKDENIKIIQLPMNVRYHEGGIIPSGFTEIFRFNNDGELSLSGPVTISTRSNSLIFKESLSSNNLLNFEFDLPYRYKLHPYNFILFKDNLLYSDANIEVKPLNMVTIDSGTGNIAYKLFHDDRVSFELDNILLPNNKAYIKEQILKYEHDHTKTAIMPDIIAPFDFSFDNSRKYQVNISNAIETICKYNSNLLGEYYSNYIRTIIYTGKELRGLADAENDIRMLRLKAETSETCVIIFHNGLIYKNYRNTIYDLNSFTFRLTTSVEDDDIFEFVYFQNVNNKSITSKIIDRNMKIFSDDYIESSNLLIFSDTTDKPQFNIRTTPWVYYPVDFTKKDNKINFARSYFYNRDLVLAAANQFKYCYFNISADTFKVKLPYEFTFCHNQLQYLVFVNGKKLQTGYKITIVEETLPINETCIYLNTVLHEKDTIEIFYLPIPMNDDVLKPLENITAEVYTTPNTNIYEIIWPYPNFYKDGNIFKVFLQDDTTELILDTDFTLIDDNTLQLSDSAFNKATKLIYHFEYRNTVGMDDTGYIRINREDAPLGIDKNLFFIFVNGKKVPLNHMQDISTNIIKITEDINSTSELSILRYITPEVQLNNYYSIWDTITNTADVETLNKMMNSYNVVTDIDPVEIAEISKLSIMNEIIRDYWMKPNINNGSPFVYTYDNTQFKIQDPGNNFIIPTWDAIKYINITENDNPVTDQELLDKYGKK